jgi:5-methylcytosine-specific restriction endonuclease McrA
LPRYKSVYPPDWSAISARIRTDRARGHCERCGNEIYSIPPGWRVSVRLAVHHIGITREDGSLGDPRDKSDCRSENLIALCQACHLSADRPLHLERARASRLRKRLARDAARGFEQLELHYG